MAYTTIDNPELYFNTVIYSGNGGTQSITSLDFQPDFLWGKQRNVNQDHVLLDSIRGTTKQLYSSDSAAEQTNTTGVTSFNSDGFSLGSSGYFNNGSNTYVAWNWLAGGSASSNSDGSITSTVSANTTSGFSIVSYTGNGTAGATIGHGLSSQLDVIFIKNRTDAEAWQTYHRPLGATHHLVLNGTDSAQDNDSRFNDVHPTSSVFTLGNNDTVNKNTSNFVAYCFHSVKGFSKMGSYTGNGNADGPFIYTGFKPAWVMIKSTGTNHWVIYDNKRNSFNLVNNKLNANENEADNIGGANALDFLSNGFKCRATNAASNGSGQEYIYMAFAEAPFVNSNGVPGNAR